MSDFRFGDDYRLNFDDKHQVKDWQYGWDEIDWTKVEWVEVDSVMFRRERTCRFENAGELPDIVHPTVWFCSECGSPIYNDMEPEYCIYCGARVERDA